MEEIVSIPTKIESFNGHKIKAISCGAYYSMALTKSGLVYEWGYNRNREIGITNSIQNIRIFTPQIIEINGLNVKEICCGYDCTLLLSYEGYIYHLINNESELLEGLIKLNSEIKFIEIAAHSLHELSAALSENDIF